MKHLFVFAAAAAAIGISGCVSIPDDRGGSSIRPLLAARSTQAAAVSWNASGTGCDGIAGPLTADGAVTVALHCSPRMRSLYAELALSQADVYAATRLSNPEIDFVRLSTGSPADIVNTTWGITQRFVEMLFLPAQQKVGAARLAASQQKVADSVLHLERDVRSAFVRYAGAVAIAELQQRNANAAQLSAETAAAFHAAGNISELQLSRERAAAVEGQVEADRAKGAALLARSKLLTMLGVVDRKPDEPLIAGELPLPPLLRDAPEVLRDAASKHRLDLVAADAQVEAFAGQVRAARGTRWVGDLSVGYEQERETGEATRAGPRASVSIPIFNSGKDKILRAAGEYEVAAAHRAELNIALHNDAASTLAAARAAHSATVAMRTQLLPLRERITLLSQREFNFMFIGAFELLAVKREELQAYRQYLEAVRDEWLANIDVQRVAGGSLPAELVDTATVGAL